jgi:hypothetical protein
MLHSEPRLGLRSSTVALSAGAVIALILCGCARNQHLLDYEEPGDASSEARFYWGQATFLTGNTTNGTFTTEQCCAIANDRLRSREARCFAAALLISYYVRPEFCSAEMKTLITDSSWVDDCIIGAGGLGTGDKPLLLKGWPFHLILFPDNVGHSEWHFYFTLHGGPIDPEHPLSDAKSFLKGELPHPSVQITEFVLYYPLPREPGGIPGMVVERHTRRGVGIRICPAGWYESD